MTMTCQVCGTTNPDGTTYCEGCGVELTAAAAPAAEPTTPAAPSDPAVAEALPVDAAPAAPTPTDPAPGDAAVPTVTDAPAPADAAVLTPELTAPELAAPVDAAPVPTDQTASEPAPTPEAAPVAVPASPAPAVPDSGTAPAARLGVKKYGAATGDFIPLQGTRLVVGRFDASSGPVDIDLSGLGGQEHISRRHAELYAEGGTWMVRDLGSTNGVYIKRAGESAFSPRLQEPAALHDGDELAFGNLMLSFHQG